MVVAGDTGVPQSKSCHAEMHREEREQVPWATSIPQNDGKCVALLSFDACLSIYFTNTSSLVL